MRVLFDQNTPVPLRHALTRHEASTAYDRGWSRFKNGELLDAAEKERFDVLVSADRKLKSQQNLALRNIAVVVLSTPSWPRIERNISAVVAAIDAATPGSYVEVDIP